NDKEPADDGKNDLMLDGDRDRAERAAKRERTRVAHKNLRGWRIEPKKTKPGANEGAANHRELARARNKINSQIGRKDCVAGEISDDSKCCRGNHNGHNGKAIETVREIDRISRRDDHKSAKGEKENPKINEKTFDRGNGKRGHMRGAELHHCKAGYPRNRGFDSKPAAARIAFVRLLCYLEQIVIKTDRAESRRHQKHDPDKVLAHIGQ